MLPSFYFSKGNNETAWLEILKRSAELPWGLSLLAQTVMRVLT